MESLYGNEWKDRLEDRLTPEQAAALAEVLAAPDPLVLNISQWHCTTGWQVPPRRIGDSLILIVKSGRVQVRIEDGEAILESGGCALIPENALHCYELAPGCEACTNYVLHLLLIVPQAASSRGVFRAVGVGDCFAQQFAAAFGGVCGFFDPDSGARGDSGGGVPGAGRRGNRSPDRSGA